MHDSHFDDPRGLGSSVAVRASAGTNLLTIATSWPFGHDASNEGGRFQIAHMGISKASPHTGHFTPSPIRFRGA